MTDEPSVDAASPHEEAVELRKEACTTALYVAICLLAALLAVPEDVVRTRVTGIIWGVTVGLAAAHWFAFRVSARLVGAGTIRSPDVRLAGAQLLGAVVVAVLASVPVVLLPQSMELGGHHGVARGHRRAEERPRGALRAHPQRTSQALPLHGAGESTHTISADRTVLVFSQVCGSPPGKVRASPAVRRWRRSEKTRSMDPLRT